MSDTTPESLLDEVNDRESFSRFVDALANERTRAAEIEDSYPNRYIVDGALGWKNADIPNFLGACIYNLDGVCSELGEEPSWRVFAHILYCGKIIE